VSISRRSKYSIHANIENKEYAKELCWVGHETNNEIEACIKQASLLDLVAVVFVSHLYRLKLQKITWPDV
jgi:hypothetical protein